jgi:hypothetical protein
MGAEAKKLADARAHDEPREARASVRDVVGGGHDGL